MHFTGGGGGLPVLVAIVVPVPPLPPRPSELPLPPELPLMPLPLPLVPPLPLLSEDDNDVLFFLGSVVVVVVVAVLVEAPEVEPPGCVYLANARRLLLTLFVLFIIDAIISDAIEKAINAKMIGLQW